MAQVSMSMSMSTVFNYQYEKSDIRQEKVNEIVVAAKWLVQLFDDHNLNNQRQTVNAKGGWGYPGPIKSVSPKFISVRGCFLAAIVGRNYGDFEPINIGAAIHYLDNHDCPNGLMPVLSLVLMELSEYELSFNEAHGIICDFAREHNEGKDGTTSAHLHWLHLSGWSDLKNNTAGKIFGGTYTKMTFP